MSDFSGDGSMDMPKIGRDTTEEVEEAKEQLELLRRQLTQGRIEACRRIEDLEDELEIQYNRRRLCSNGLGILEKKSEEKQVNLT